MKILSRYVFREFLTPLFYCLAGFISIYVLFELFGSFSRLADSQPPFGMIVKYFLSYLAPFFHYLAPAALMLATLYTMWNFCRHSELVAMRASGIGFLTIVKPLLSVALAMSLFVLWVNEVYVPRNAQWAKQFRNERFDEEKLSKADNIVFRNARSDRTWSIDSMPEFDGSVLLNVRVTVDRPGGTRLKNITAPRAEYLDGEWWFTDPVVQHYDVSGREIASPVPELDALKFRSFPELGERPGDFIMQNRDWAYNSISDRIRYLRHHPDLSERLRDKYRYDVWAQIMAPWACIIITLFAIPAGIASGRQSVFKGILGALGMFFAFYGVVIAGMIFADLGFVPPVIAAVFPYLLFLGVGVWMFRRQR